MKKKIIKNILGISILEGLVATAIVGIGFVAVLQMVTYAATSMYTSGERTKANYIVSMLAEDIIGYKDTHFGVSAAPIEGAKKTIQDDDGNDIEVDVTIDPADNPKFSEKLRESGYNSKGTGDRGCTQSKKVIGDVNNVYKDQKYNAYENKEKKWNEIIGGDRYLACKGKLDLKKVKVYNINSFTGTYKYPINHFNLGHSFPNASSDIPTDPPDDEAHDYYFYDEAMYIGRIQINLNNGKKRKFLYFQSDYKIKK